MAIEEVGVAQELEVLWVVVPVVVHSDILLEKEDMRAADPLGDITGAKVHLMHISSPHGSVVRMPEPDCRLQT